MGRDLVYVSAEACRSVLTPADVCEQVEKAFHAEAAGRILYSDPRVVRMKTARGGGHAGSIGCKTKGAILPEFGVAGFRLGASLFHEDGTLDSTPLATRLVLLMDIETAAPLALVDEHYNFRLRTAASVAVALQHLTPPRPDLGIIGVGDIGMAVAHVFIHLFEPSSLHLTSRKQHTRQHAADQLRAQYPNTPVHVHDTVAELTDRTNLIIAATNTNQTLVRPEDVRPGATICALGKYEVHPDIYTTVDKLVIDDWQQTSKAADIRPLVENETLTPQHIYAHSIEIVTGARPGRVNNTETILLRSEGIGSHDIAIAHHAYTQALEKGLATQLNGA